MEEVNADREIHGKKLFDDDDEDHPTAIMLKTWLLLDVQPGFSADWMVFLKKVEKVVDKRGVVWYSTKAVRCGWSCGKGFANRQRGMAKNI